MSHIYLVWDRATKRAAIIDSALDFDPKSGRTATHSAQAILNTARDEGLSVEWLLETHAHADHLSAAPFLKQATGAPIVIGEHIRDVQKVFESVFNLAYVTADGRPFDRLLSDGEVLPLGDTTIRVLHTPGHTPACVSYLIGDALFVGDTMFMPDYGSCGLSRRRRADALPLDPKTTRPTGQNARLCVSRLQGPGP